MIIKDLKELNLHVARTEVYLEGVKYEYITQDYYVGTYLAVYVGAELIQQASIRLNSYKYHKDVRKDLESRGVGFTGTDLDSIKPVTAAKQKFKEPIFILGGRDKEPVQPHLYFGKKLVEIEQMSFYIAQYPAAISRDKIGPVNRGFIILHYDTGSEYLLPSHITTIKEAKANFMEKLNSYEASVDYIKKNIERLWAENASAISKGCAMVADYKRQL